MRVYTRMHAPFIMRARASSAYPHRPSAACESAYIARIDQSELALSALSLLGPVYDRMLGSSALARAWINKRLRYILGARARQHAWVIPRRAEIVRGSWRFIISV